MVSMRAFFCSRALFALFYMVLFRKASPTIVIKHASTNSRVIRIPRSSIEVSYLIEFKQRITANRVSNLKRNIYRISSRILYRYHYFLTCSR